MIKISTEDAICASRFPVRFYALVHDLTGKAATYNNPGVSLRSFVVSRFLDRELVVLDGSMEENFNECVEFSDVDNTFKVASLLITQATKLFDEVNNLPGNHLHKFVDLMSSIRDKCDLVNETVSKSECDQITEFKELLYDLQELILTAGWMVSEIISGKSGT